MRKFAIVCLALIASAPAAYAYDYYSGGSNALPPLDYSGADAILFDQQRRDLDFNSGYQGMTYVTPQAGCETSCISEYYNPMTGAHGSILVDPIPY